MLKRKHTINPDLAAANTLLALPFAIEHAPRYLVHDLPNKTPVMLSIKEFITTRQVTAHYTHKAGRLYYRVSIHSKTNHSGKAYTSGDAPLFGTEFIAINEISTELKTLKEAILHKTEAFLTALEPHEVAQLLSSTKWINKNFPKLKTLRADIKSTCFGLTSTTVKPPISSLLHPNVGLGLGIGAGAGVGATGAGATGIGATGIGAPSVSATTTIKSSELRPTASPFLSLSETTESPSNTVDSDTGTHRK